MQKKNYLYKQALVLNDKVRVFWVCPNFSWIWLVAVKVDLHLGLDYNAGEIGSIACDIDSQLSLDVHSLMHVFGNLN